MSIMLQSLNVSPLFKLNMFLFWSTETFHKNVFGLFKIWVSNLAYVLKIDLWHYSVLKLKRYNIFGALKLKCLPPSCKEWFEKGQREATIFTIDKKYRNSFKAHARNSWCITDVGRAWMVQCLSKKFANSQNHFTTHTPWCMLAKPNNSKLTVPPTCKNASQQHAQLSEAKFVLHDNRNQELRQLCCGFFLPLCPRTHRLLSHFP